MKNLEKSSQLFFLAQAKVEIGLKESLTNSIKQNLQEEFADSKQLNEAICETVREEMQKDYMRTKAKYLTLDYLKQSFLDRIKASESDISNLTNIALNSLKLQHPSKSVFSDKEIQEKASLIIEQKNQKQLKKYMKRFNSIANSIGPFNSQVALSYSQDDRFFSEQPAVGKKRSRQPFTDLNTNNMPPPKLPRTG